MIWLAPGLLFTGVVYLVTVTWLIVTTPWLALPVSIIAALIVWWLASRRDHTAISVAASEQALTQLALERTERQERLERLRAFHASPEGQEAIRIRVQRTTRRAPVPSASAPSGADDEYRPEPWDLNSI